MGLTDTVELLLTVVLAVSEAVPLPDCEGVPVDEAEGVCVPVPVELQDTEPVLDAEAPTVTDAVDDIDVVLLALRVVEGVLEGVGKPEGVQVPDGVLLPVSVGMTEALKEGLPLLEDDAPLVREAVGVAKEVVLAETVKVLVAVGVPLLLVAFGEADDSVPLPTRGGVGEAVKLPLLVMLSGMPIDPIRR